MADAADLFDAIAPELSDDNRKTTFLDLADGQTSNKAFADQRAYAVALLAAHMLTIAERRGTSGRVGSMNEGQLSVSFNHVGLGSNELSATSYGQELQRMRKSYIMGARTVHV